MTSVKKCACNERKLSQYDLSIENQIFFYSSEKSKACKLAVVLQMSPASTGKPTMDQTNEG